ncbi:MAG: LPS export ABC transporter permease LptG [Pseudomonadota bacterium]
MTLHFYFARRFAGWLGIVFVAILTLIVLVDLVDQTRRFAERGVAAGQIFELTLLNLPATLNLVLPLIVLLGTIAFFVSLSRSSELVATRAAGRSAISALMAPVGVTFLIGIFATTMLNPIVAGTSKKYEWLTENYRSGSASTLSISSEGLWLRQPTADGQMVIRAWRSNNDGSVLYDVTFLAYEDPGSPIWRIEAASATLHAGEWRLRNAKSWPLARELNAEGNATEHETLVIPSSLTIEGIRESFGRPSTISIWKLQDFIDQLDRAGFSSIQHRVWLQSEVARPLFMMAMVLVAGAFTMRHARAGGTGIAVMSAVLLGFALYFLRSFVLILGENGQLSVYLAAWAPPIASILLAFGPLLHKEDG